MDRLFLGRLTNKVRSDRFLTDSFVFFTGSLLVSAGNYLFHSLMARMLSVENYGQLQSLIAISAVFGIPVASLATVLIKYVAHFRARQQLNKVYGLFSLFTKKILIIASGFSFVFFFLNQYIANFLNLDSGLPVIILGLSFLPSFLGSVNRGIIQGLEKFKAVSLVSIAGICFKVLLGVLLVKVGFEVNGAIGAIALAGFIGYFIAFLPLKFLFKEEKAEVEDKEIFQFFFPVLFMILFLTLFYNIDVILVKHFMSPHTAGEYGALALIGHIVFFLVGPVVGVMFPRTAAAYSNHKDSTKVFKKTLFLVSLIGLGVLVFYFLFPSFVIRILVGSKFLSINRFLGPFGISMFLYSLVSLFSQYFLSIHKTCCIFILGTGVLMQVILISLWHANLWQIVWIMNGVMFTVLAMLTLYYLYQRNFKFFKIKC